MGQGSGRWSLVLRSHEGEEDELVAQGGGGPDDYLGPGAHPGTAPLASPWLRQLRNVNFLPGRRFHPDPRQRAGCEGPPAPCQRTSTRGSRPPAGSGQAEAAALDLRASSTPPEAWAA